LSQKTKKNNSEKKTENSRDTMRDKEALTVSVNTQHSALAFWAKPVFIYTALGK